LDQDGVKTLLDQTLSLIRQIARSDIDPPIREYLLRHLQIVADALFDARTQGFESLWNGLTASQGHYDSALHRKGVTVEKIKKCPEWQTVVAILAGVAALVDMAQRVDYVIEKGEKVSDWWMAPRGGDNRFILPEAPDKPLDPSDT
jgi:hypothetical protein